ncbi:MAG: hypothetical protein ACRDCE_21975 [Cetobacterium sp.]|uniref:hypothetical protein n=1 Tax=Cetobacterium sp. TaxID=2071632 RepID=UPI003EE587BC
MEAVADKTNLRVGEKATVTVTVKRGNDPEVGERLSYSAGLGTLSVSTPTDANGVSTTTYTASQVGKGYITVSYGGISKTVEFTNQSATAEIVTAVANPTSIAKGAKSTITITSMKGGQPVTGKTYGVTVDKGAELSSIQVTTGAGGSATVELTNITAATAGLCTVTVKEGQSTVATTTVTLEDNGLTVTANPNPIAGKEGDTIDVSLSVSRNGSAVPGVKLDVTAVGGGGTTLASDTDASGNSSFQYQALVSGSLSVEIKEDGVDKVLLSIPANIASTKTTADEEPVVAKAKAVRKPRSKQV